MIINKKENAYQKLVEGIEKIIHEGKYKDFLKFMKKFHKYSFSNRLLIYSQNPDATHVAGYCTWKELGRGVKSNPKRIHILKPMPYKITQKENTEEEESIELLRYSWTIVYDISDTYKIPGAKEVPLFDDITLNSCNSQELYNILTQISPVSVKVESTWDGSDGYYSKSENKIVVSPRLSIDDKTATLLHEISHVLYDDFDYSKERNLSEIFVESIAYIVADYFGFNTSKSSFSYITKWSKGDMKNLLKLGKKIQEASDDMINRIQAKIEQQKKNVA